VIVFDQIGTGYTDGTPRDSVEGFADGAVEFIEALGPPQVDLLGWTPGGTVAQHVTLTRPDLVRKLIVAAANPRGQAPDAPAPTARQRHPRRLQRRRPRLPVPARQGLRHAGERLPGRLTTSRHQLSPATTHT
jgi:pimeloyl-ACP methyl ester carboxylesterase